MRLKYYYTNSTFYETLNSNQLINTITVTVIYCSLVRCVSEYGSILWNNNIERLERIQEDYL